MRGPTEAAGSEREGPGGQCVLMITPPPAPLSPTAVQENGEGQETALRVPTPGGIVGLVQFAPPSMEAMSRGGGPTGLTSPPTATHVVVGAHETP